MLLPLPLLLLPLCRPAAAVSSDGGGKKAWPVTPVATGVRDGVREGVRAGVRAGVRLRDEPGVVARDGVRLRARAAAAGV